MKAKAIRYILFTALEMKLLSEHRSTDSTKYALSGMFLSDKEEDTIVCIDGRRMVSIHKHYPKDMAGTILPLPTMKLSESAFYDIKDRQWIVFPRKYQDEYKKLLKKFKTKDITGDEFPGTLPHVEDGTPLNGKFPNYLMFVPTPNKDAIRMGISGGLFMKEFKYSLAISSPLAPMVGTLLDVNYEMEFRDHEPRIVIMPMKMDHFDDWTERIHTRDSVMDALLTLPEKERLSIISAFVSDKVKVVTPA